MISYLCKSLRVIGLVWPTRLVILAMGEVLSFVFNLAVSSPSDKVGVARHVFVLLLLSIKRWGLFIHEFTLSTSCHLA